jgi:putative Holliday junction resolvase
MGRILAIDYGTKRVGFAVTDENKIIANGLTTLPNKDVIPFLMDYIKKEKVECFVVGEPKQMNNQESESAKHVDIFIKLLIKNFPNIPIERMDERYTSKMAFQTMIDSGISKKHRQDKSLIDKISATIILQSYMEKKNNGETKKELI